MYKHQIVMKAYMNGFACAILFACVLVFSSCSSENPIELQVNEDEILLVNSTTVQLIEQTVSNDGSFDNIIDGSSCFDISFPYTVMVNGFEITIESLDDLEEVEKLLDALDTDVDIVDIVFPITITNSDYTEVTLNGVSDLQAIAEKCIEGGADDDIECIDIIYPVTLFTYNKDLEKTNTFVVESDKDLRRFFGGLGESDIISIEYPVVFEMHDGTKVTANNNEELEDAMRLAKDVCDEDDDNDYNDDDFTKELLDSALIDCSWKVKEFVRSDIQAIAAEEYFDFILNFKEDGTLFTSDLDGNILTGEWSTRVSDYRVKLTLNFEYLEVFSLEWFVYEIDEDKIKLFIGEDDNKIILSKACEEPNIECSEAFISDALSAECLWTISNGDSSGFLDDLRIDFSSMNIHVYDSSSSPVDEGNWEISGTILKFNDLSMELTNYVGDWQIIECRADRFKMKRGEEYLVIEKESD